MKKPTLEELKAAQTTIFEWFVSENQREDVLKPITLLDTVVELNGAEYRLITHFSFYGRNELPALDDVEIIIDNNLKGDK